MSTDHAEASPQATSVTKIVAFLRDIGIEVRLESIADKTLLPGVEIRHGALIVDALKLSWPGDLLHEAGHLAVMPAALRAQMHGELTDGPSAAQAGEPEATAWAYAAALALGLAPEVLFHGGGYHGQSASLIFTFSCGVYPGLAGLAAGGIAATPEAVRAGESPAYPSLLRWLRA